MGNSTGSDRQKGEKCNPLHPFPKKVEVLLHPTVTGFCILELELEMSITINIIIIRHMFLSRHKVVTSQAVITDE